MSGRTSTRYPVELRERAVRMVGEIRPDHESDWAAMTQVATLLGVGTPETVRKWCRQAEVDGGKRPGVTTQESTELKRLKRENAELRRANAILRSASGFLRGRTRPATALIVTYIDSVAGHRDEGGLRWGVESICNQLTELGAKIAPATYYEHRARKPTAREVSDADLKPKIAAVHVENYGVYGARKVWLTLNRERPAGAPPIARCTVERLMGELELAGAVRGKVKRTTISDPKAVKPLDLVDRNFRPLAPDRLWVADFTYVSTWSGWCYTAFVIDAYARRILGWAVATTMTSRFVVDAVEQAIWTRGREGRDLAGLIAHHDHGVQYLSVAYSEHLATAGIKPSTGAVGSSHDNALAESVIGLYKTELIKPRRPWKGLDDLEIATAEWVDWFNRRRPFEYCDDLTPVEAETAHYAHHQTPAIVGVSN
ncbi:IS3 family transposase [Janibacter indicus]|uniref:IS3 family transposase n=1 Tax=Janibacter indicus TaxID=857417 RepID=A0A7L9IZZ9_9MICO|nr:IS3 family transposase [Janibacter indicus]QOK22383.1 IS3 family transposase [Janibacter indicus]